MPSSRRCLICVQPTLVVANQMLRSVHPANPLKADAHFHLDKRKSADTRVAEAWQLFHQRCAPAAGGLCRSLDCFIWSARLSDSPSTMSMNDSTQGCL